MNNAILAAADGQSSIPTRHDARFQDAVTGGAHAAERWLSDLGPLSLAEHLAALQYNAPESARQPALDGFLLRLEQRLRALALPAPAASQPAETDNPATPPAAALPACPAPEPMAVTAEGVRHG